MDPALDGIGYEEGKLYTRFDDVGPFVEDQGRDLAFRLIGTPGDDSPRGMARGKDMGKGKDKGMGKDKGKGKRRRK